MSILIKYISGLIAGKFYGTLTIKFESGVIVSAKEEKSLPKSFFEGSV